VLRLNSRLASIKIAVMVLNFMVCFLDFKAA
jgi:hypothetical protein